MFSKPRIFWEIITELSLVTDNLGPKNIGNLMDSN